MPKWLLDRFANSLTPLPLSKMPCANVMLAGMPYFSIWRNASPCHCAMYVSLVATGSDPVAIAFGRRRPSHAHPQGESQSHQGLQCVCSVQLDHGVFSERPNYFLHARLRISLLKLLRSVLWKTLAET